MRALAHISRWLQDLPIRKKLSLLGGILVFNILTLILLAVLGLNILSSVRAYVGGEGLWAKAQKNAIYSLSRYAVSLREEDYQEYLAHLKTPLGDRKARLELSKREPDLSVSDAGFLEGGNHPEDVRGMAQLFRRFHRFGPIRRAIVIWEQADNALIELQELGSRFRGSALRTRPSAAETAAFIVQLEALNDRLTDLENAFSSTMGEAARAATRLVILAMVACSLGVGLLSLLVAQRVSRGILAGLNRIGEAAGKAARGDLSARVKVASKDELGGLAQAFNAMTEGLARIDRLKSEFVSNVSHELRTPLTLNLAPLEALMSGDYGPLNDPQRQAMAVMRNNLLRLLQMINGLLDFAKLDAGRMEVRREPSDLCKLTESVVADFVPLAKAKGIALSAELSSDPPVVMMDRYLFERVLFNLLSNALKFTPQAGSVELRMRAAHGRLELTVADSGVGIAETDQERLFKKFFQAESSATRRFEGTGLGLAMVKECAQLLRGEVSLRSQLGQGSAFSVACDAPPAPAGSQAQDGRSGGWAMPSGPIALAAEAEPAADGNLPRVLVAEDNPELAAFIRSLLIGTCQVQICHDGLQALQAARSSKPDLILSDVMMPGLDGVSLTRELKRGVGTAGIPVVLLTALVDQSSLLRGWEAGADDYLFKPFHPKELQARVRSLLAMVVWRRRSEESRQRQEIVGQFARIASHDLKAPLRTLSGYAGLLLSEAGPSLSSDARGHIQVIIDSATQMNKMIEALIRYSHLDSGTDGFAPCDLNQVLDSVVAMLAPDIAVAGAELKVGPMPTVSGLPQHLFAVFQNLISNSLKYRDPDRPLGIIIRAEPQNGEWAFSVWDNGLGFDPAQKEAVFSLFKRLSDAPEVEGDGMGLAIVKKIIEFHHGRIWADPRPGDGVTFHFTLPAAQPTTALAA